LCTSASDLPVFNAMQQVGSGGLQISDVMSRHELQMPQQCSLRFYSAVLWSS